MNTSPLVTVIVPVYNTAKYLRKCLNSICGQSYRNLEIICVDDGSTDDSASILQEYAEKDNRIKIFSQSNSGLAATRNLGLRHTSGEWVTGVDSDDYLDEDAIEYTMQGACEDCDIIFNGMTMEWVDCHPESDVDYKPYTSLSGMYQTNAELLLKTPHEFCGKLWRVRFLRRYNCQFPNGLWYEDWFFYWAFAPCARAISYRPVPKYHYLRYSSSLMGQTLQKVPKSFDYMSVLELLLAHRAQHPLPGKWNKLTLYNFLHSRHCALVRVPENLVPAVHQSCCDLIKKYQLHKEFSILQTLLPVPWFLKPFISKRFGKMSYRIFGLPIISIHYRDSVRVVRFFGIKIHKNNLMYYGGSRF